MAVEIKDFLQKKRPACNLLKVSLRDKSFRGRKVRIFPVAQRKGYEPKKRRTNGTLAANDKTECSYTGPVSRKVRYKKK